MNSLMQKLQRGTHFGKSLEEVLWPSYRNHLSNW